MAGLQSPFSRFGTRCGAGRGRWANRLCRGALVGCLLIAGAGPGVSSAVASTPMVDLGAATSYAALSGASVGNTVSAAGAPHTTLHGDLGVKANTQPAGFPPGIVTGVTHVGDLAAAQAHAGLVAAYEEVAGRTGGAALPGALAGATITPGLHTVTGAVSNTSTVTLDGQGNPNAVFVFQVGGAMAMAAGSHVVLTGKAQASRVFWQVNGAGAIGANADFAGTLMALDAVAVGNGSVFNGRALARNGALTLDANEVYSAPPVVTITGGATATTTDTTPTLSGTTDVQAPSVVTVTINGQTLSALPSDRAWSVTSALLANATYPVVASVTDGAGNPGSASQQLTVDTVPPIVTLDGGTSVTTNDRTPTIAGASDIAPGTIVRVTVDAQTLSAVVQSGGTWNVTPAALADGVRTITASVTDPAGNPGTVSQSLTVDTVAPALTITGGPSALTKDPTPSIQGTAAVTAGTTVTVTLADETLLGVVRDDGTWTVTAATLSDGPHRVVTTVADAAGNPASVNQRLTVDTVPPVLAITGGATLTTNHLEATIRGTSDAAPGTPVTVTIAGQIITTLLQLNGTWNATPTAVGEGTWAVVASATDPAGNIGQADQTLTVTADPPPSAASTGPAATPAVPTATLVTPAPAPHGDDLINALAIATVAPNRNQKVHGALLSIGTKVTAVAGRIVATATGTVTIHGAGKAIELTTVTAKIAAARSATLTLKPKGTRKAVTAAVAKIRAALRSSKKASATITVRIADAAGHSRTIRRTVRLVP